MKLPEILRELRKASRLSQAELSERLGFTQQTVGKWETGRHLPDYDTLLRLAAFFHVSVDYLLGNEDIRQLYWKDEGGGWSASLSPAEARLLKNYRRLNPDGRAKIEALTEDFTDIPKYKERPVQGAAEI